MPAVTAGVPAVVGGVPAVAWGVPAIVGGVPEASEQTSFSAGGPRIGASEAPLLLDPGAASALPARRVAARSPRSSQPKAPAPFRDWTRLQYTTSKLLIFSGELNLSRSASGGRTSVRADSVARLFGSPFVNSWSTSTMDGASGRPLEFLEVRPRKRAERWGFARSAVEHAILKPHKGKEGDPIESWRVVKSETLPGPGGEAGGDPSPGTGAASGGSQAGSRRQDEPSQWVHDYVAMIVRLKDLPLRKVGDEATVRVSTSRGPAPMRVRVAEERTRQRSLSNLATGSRARVELHELRLRVTPQAGSSADTRSFLDMEGETELWVEATTRTLTEISGNVPKVPGRVVITLAGYR